MADAETAPDIKIFVHTVRKARREFVALIRQSGFVFEVDKRRTSAVPRNKTKEGKAELEMLKKTFGEGMKRREVDHSKITLSDLRLGLGEVKTQMAE